MIFCAKSIDVEGTWVRGVDFSSTPTRKIYAKSTCIGGTCVNSACAVKYLAIHW